MNKGEKVMEIFKRSFKEIQDQNPNIQGAFISGTIGALESSILSYRNNNTKKYEHQTFKDSMEIVSLSGNFSFKPKQQFFAHIHVGLSGSDFIQYGGRTSYFSNCLDNNGVHDNCNDE
jgi:predicted DNA-binding protein with PD1-like motif